MKNSKYMMQLGMLAALAMASGPEIRIVPVEERPDDIDPIVVEPREPTPRPYRSQANRMPHQGQREMARRAKQMAKTPTP